MAEFFLSVPKFERKLQRFADRIHDTDPPLTGAELCQCQDMASFNMYFEELEDVRPCRSREFTAIQDYLAPFGTGSPT